MFEDVLVVARARERERRRLRRELEERAEDEYMRRFGAGALRRGVTFGSGRSTRAPLVGRLVVVEPSGDSLHRHAQRFGSEGVSGVARAYGNPSLRPAPAGAPKRRRRTSAELREAVAGLHGRGVVPAAIADALNVSDRRVKDLLRELAA